MKWVTVILSVTVVVVSTASAKVYTEEFDWSGGENAEKFLLDVSSSDVTVKPGGDSIVIKAIKKAKKEEDLDKVDVVVTDEGNVVKTSVKYTKEKDNLLGFLIINNVSIDFEITLPADVALGLNTSSGDSEIAGIDVVGIDASSGDIDLFDCKVVVIDSSSGDVTITHGEKAIVDLSSGDIVISGVSSVEVDASSSDVDIIGAYKRAEVDVSSGDITISNTGKRSESIIVDTTSGDITADFKAPEKGGIFSFECTSGEVVLNLLGDINNLDLTTEGFLDDVEIYIPGLSAVKIKKGVYSAKSGDGSNKIDVTSASGSIKVITKE